MRSALLLAICSTTVFSGILQADTALRAKRQIIFNPSIGVTPNPGGKPIFNGGFDLSKSNGGKGTWNTGVHHSTDFSNGNTNVHGQFETKLGRNGGSLYGGGNVGIDNRGKVVPGVQVGWKIPLGK